MSQLEKTHNVLRTSLALGPALVADDMNASCISPFKEISTLLKVLFDPVKRSGPSTCPGVSLSS